MNANKELLEYIQLEHLSNFQFNAKKCAKEDWLPFFAFWKANGAPTAAGNPPNWSAPHVMVTRLGLLRKNYIFPSGNLVFFELVWDYIGRLGLDYLQNHQHGPRLNFADATSETDKIVTYWKTRCGKSLKKATNAAETPDANVVPQSISARIPSDSQPPSKRKSSSTPNLQPDTGHPRKLVKLVVRGSDESSSEANSLDPTVGAPSSAIRTKISATDASLSTEADLSGDETKSENDSASSGKEYIRSQKQATSSGTKPSSSGRKAVTYSKKVTTYGKKATTYGKKATPPGKKATSVDRKQSSSGSQRSSSKGKAPATRNSRLISGDETWSEDDADASIKKALSSVKKANSTPKASSSIVNASSSAMKASGVGKKASTSKKVSFSKDTTSPKNTRFGKKEPSRNNASSSKGKDSSTGNNNIPSSKGTETSTGYNGPSSRTRMSSSHGKATRSSDKPYQSDSSAIPSVDGASSTTDPLTDPPSSSSSSSSDNDNNGPPPSPPAQPPATSPAPLPWNKAGLLVFLATNYAHNFASIAAKAFSDADTLIDNITAYVALPADEMEAKRASVLHELALWKAYHKLETEKIENDETFMMDNMVQRLKDNGAENDTIVAVEELRHSMRRDWLKRHVEVIGDTETVADGGEQVDNSGEQGSGEQESGEHVPEEQSGEQAEEQGEEQGAAEQESEVY